MAEQLNTDILTRDMFEAEQRKTFPSYDPTMPRQFRDAHSATEVVQDYADRFTGGDPEAFIGLAYEQGFRIDQALNYAEQTPNGLAEYQQARARVLNTSRQREAEAPIVPVLSADDVAAAKPMAFGEEGLLSADLEPNQYRLALAHPTDPSYTHIKALATAFHDELPPETQEELPLMDAGYEINSGWIAKAAEEKVLKSGAKYDDPDFQEKYEKERLRQLNGWMAMRTVGLHSATVKFAINDFSGEEASSLSKALAPNVRYIGIGKAGYPLFLAESATKQGFRMFDAPTSGFIGALKYGIDEGPIDGAMRGIVEESSFSGEAADFGKTSGVPGGKYVFGAPAFILDLVAPDLATLATMGVGASAKAVKVAKGADSFMEAFGGFTKANKASKQLAEAERIVLKGVKENNVADIEEGVRMIQAVKGKYPEMAKEFDRVLETRGARKAKAARDAVASGKYTPEEAEELLTILHTAGEVPIQKVMHRTADTPAASASFELRPAKLAAKMQTKGATPMRAKAGKDSVYNYSDQLRRIDADLEELARTGTYTVNADEVVKTLNRAYEARVGAVRADLDALAEAGKVTKVDLKKATKAFKKEVSARKEALKTLVESEGKAFKFDAKVREDALQSFDEALAEITNKLDLTKGQEAFEKSKAKVAKAKEIAQKRAKAFETGAEKHEKLLDEAWEAQGEAVSHQKFIDGLAQISDTYPIAREQLVKQLDLTELVVGRINELRAEVKALRATEDIHLTLYTQAKQLIEFGVPEKEIAQMYRIMEQENAVTILAKRYTTAMLERAKSSSHLRTIRKTLKDQGVEAAFKFSNTTTNEQVVKELAKVQKQLQRNLKTAYREGMSGVKVDGVGRVRKVQQGINKKLRALDNAAAKANSAMVRASRKQAALRKKATRKLELAQKLDARLLKAEAADLARKPVTLSDAPRAQKVMIAKLHAAAADALDDTVAYFFGGKNKARLASQQLVDIRKAVMLNAATYGETAGEMATLLMKRKATDPTLSGAADTTKRLARIPGIADLFRRAPDLDPEKVPNVLHIFENKYNLDKGSIIAAINAGKPLRVTGEGGESILLSARYIAEKQNAENVKALGDAIMEDPRIAMNSSLEGVQAFHATDVMDQLIFRGSEGGPKSFAVSVVRDVLIGGHVHAELADINPFTREAVLEITRGVAQITSDTAKLLKGQEYDTLAKMFSGEGARFDNGRHVLSSRSVSVVGSYSRTVNTFVDRIPAGDREKVLKFLRAPLNAEGKVDTIALRADPQLHEGLQLFKDYLLSGKQVTDAEVAQVVQEVDDYGELIISDTLRMPSALRDAVIALQKGSGYDKANSITHETITAVRAIWMAGQNMSDPVAATKAMFKGIRNAYATPTNVNRGWEALHRVAPMMAAHTQAASAVHRVGDYNLLVGMADYKEWQKYIMGMSPSDEFRDGALVNIRKAIGNSTDMTPVDVLGEIKFLPGPAGRAHAQALMKAVDQSHKVHLSPAGQAEKGSMVFDLFTSRIMQQRVIGTVLFRSPFGIDMVREGWDSTFAIAGLPPAAIHTARMFTRIPTMFPGVIQATHAAQRVLKRSAKFFGTTGELDEAPAAVEQVAKVAAELGPASSLRLADSVSDKVLELYGKFVGQSKWGISVNKILEGSDELIEVHGKPMTYSALRSLFVGRGVTGGAFQSNYFATNLFESITGVPDPGDVDEAASVLSKMLDITNEEGYQFFEMIQNYAENLGERERIGHAVSMIQAGYSPVEASMMTTRILMDYQTRMSSLDRQWWVKALVPFWAYRKNNARLQLDILLNPVTAWRAGLNRRAIDSSAEAAQNYLDTTYQDELGVEEHLMSAEDRADYQLFKSELKRMNGGEDLTTAQIAKVRAMMLGITSVSEYKGQLFNVDHDIHELRQLMMTVDFEKYVGFVPNPAALIKPWHRDRTNIIIPKSLGHKRTKDLRSVAQEAEWNYITLPEAGQMSALRHFVTAGSLAAEIALGTAEVAGIYDSGLPQRARSMHITEQVKELLSIEFMPVNRLVLGWLGAGTPEADIPVRVPNYVGDTFRQFGIGELVKSKEVKIEGVTVRETRTYIPAWVANYLNFVPLAEGTLKDVTSLDNYAVGTSGEFTYDTSLMMLKLFGLRVERTAAQRVMYMSEPSFAFETKTPPTR